MAQSYGQRLKICYRNALAQKTAAEAHANDVKALLTDMGLPIEQLQTRETRVRGRPRKSQEKISQPAAEAGEIPKQVRILAERFPDGAPWPELRAALGYKETAPPASFDRRYVNTGLVTVENGIYRVAAQPQAQAA